MEYLYELPKGATGLVGFVRNLGYDLEAHLKTKNPEAKVMQSEMDHTPGSQGWMLYAMQEECTTGEIMITPSRQDKREGALTIDRFQGVRISGGCYAPDSLIDAAKSYNKVSAFLESKFGKMINSHDGRDIYRAFVNQYPALKKEK